MFRFSKHKKILRSDQELLGLYSDTGKIDFLGELYDRYVHIVYGTCLKYLKNREASKDAVMQIFEKVLTDLKGREIKNFNGWFYVVAKNFCLMELRKSGKSSDIDRLEEHSLQVFMESAEDLHPEDRISLEITSENLNKCLDELSEPQRKCIELFYYDDKCYEEINLLTGYDLKKVKSYLQNGRRNLKNCMDKQHVEKTEPS